MAYGVSLYLAGPMHGIEEFNYPAFNRAAEGLRGVGFTVVNPAEFEDGDIGFGDSGSVDYEETTVSPLARAAFLRRDFGALVECDGIVLLPGWEQSKGANAELAVAKMVGLGVFVLDEDGLHAAPRLRFMWGRVVDHINEVESDFVQYRLGGFEG